VAEKDQTDAPWNVLVVEDNPDHGLMMQRTLTNDGRIHVTLARNAANAHKELDAKDYHAIVSDHRLPDSDGVTFIKDARAAGYSGVVLLVTAQASDEIAEAGIKAGADDYVFKARGYANRVLEELLAHLGDGE
jgi:DNA-binding response OmpR family regulator